jgi:hypothetical protein
MTPTKRLQNNFSRFKKLTDIYFDFRSLNKSAPKTNFAGCYTYEKKGVISDIIYIFGNKSGRDSFSFIFDFHDKEESDYTIKFQYKPENRVHENRNKYDNCNKEKASKLNKDIISSKDYTIDEFKVIFNSLIKELTLVESNKGLSYLSIMELVNKSFLKDRISFSDDISKANKRIEEETKIYKEDYDKLFKEVEKESSLVSEMSTKFNKEIKNTDEYKNAAQLTLELEKAKRKLAKVEREILEPLKKRTKILKVLKINLEEKKDEILLIRKGILSKEMAIVKAGVKDFFY